MSETCFDLVNIVSSVEHMSLLLNQNLLKIFKPCKRRKSFWLNFILVCLFIKGKSVTSDWSVNCGSVVGVLFNDVTMRAFKLNVLSSLVHLSKDLNSFPLDLSQSSFFILGLFVSDLLCSLGVAFFDTFLTIK